MRAKKSPDLQTKKWKASGQYIRTYIKKEVLRDTVLAADIMSNTVVLSKSCLRCNGDVYVKYEPVWSMVEANCFQCGRGDSLTYDEFKILVN